MKTFIREIKITGIDKSQHGYGNGYVVVPKGHPLYGVDYYGLTDIDVHGGLSFSGFAKDYKWLNELDDDEWVIGFDTGHCGDNQLYCDKEYCINETKKLAKQIKEYKSK